MYDFVIVGAGSAGCVLAARLSEDPDVQVCLVEAGGPDTVQNIHIPAMFGQLFRTRCDWDYDSHEESVLGNRRIFLPRGRVLGGTSSINAMLYIRGNRLDYDGWNQPGWSYDELLPYFKRSEDNERGESEYHGAGGPLSVSDGRSQNPSSKAIVDAAIEAGHPFNDDFNAGTQDGFGYFQLTQRNGRRCSAADAFLHPVLDRPNLTVETHLQVHRVLIENGRAVGVTGERLDGMVTLRAEREVILSAGAYNSPKLLMNSGVGPADLLHRLGIQVELDQPRIGQNLQDHPFTPLIFTHSRPVSLLIAADPKYGRQFAEEGRGPLTSNGPEVGGFVRTRSGLSAPDVVFFAAPLMFPDSGLSMPSAHAISYGPVLLTPRSRGQVTIIAADPTAKPKIEHNYFSDPADLDAAVEGVRIAMDIAGQPALAPYTETHYQAPASDSDADLRTFVSRRAHSMFHATGTCEMGQVVDADLRVRGIDGLRVADASVMPTVGRGGTNASAIVIGERAADLVRNALPVTAVA
jgi:choline dehydrogenase